jgi:hypothetical protein
MRTWCILILAELHALATSVGAGRITRYHTILSATPLTMSNYEFKSEDIATGAPGYVPPLSVAFSPDGTHHSMLFHYRMHTLISPLS